jgi:integrase
MARIDQVTTRGRLKPRAEPYWRTIRRGQSLGYRAGAATWVARIYHAGRNTYKALGAEVDLDYKRALEAAEEWWRVMTSGAPRGYTVLQAVEDYCRTKTEDATPRAAAAFWRELRSLAKHLSGELLGREVAELTTAELERWRGALPVKTATKRRVFAGLAAALSNAHRLYGVGDLSTWRRVRPVKIAKATRARLFIPTESEVEALLKRAAPDFAVLVRAAVHTGCRYGELAALEVGDFDPVKGTLALRVSKTGEREVLLSSAAVSFFTEQARGKLPRSRMFTTAEGTPWEKSMQHRRMRAATSTRAFVFYSLRHFALSRQLAAGIPSALVAKNAGTSEAMVRMHYHQWIHEEVRALFDRAPAIA